MVVDAKPVWSNEEGGWNTIVGREGIVEGSDAKIYKQKEIKPFASEEDFEAYMTEYKKTNASVYIRRDTKNENLYYIDFPQQQLITGSGNVAEEGMIFLTRIKNLFCRPTSQDMLVLPVLLLLILGIVHIAMWIISLSALSHNETIFLFVVWLWLILLSIFLIRGIYIDE